MVELASRGHNVTVYNTFPKDYTVPNYTNVSLQECFRIEDKVFSIDELFGLVQRSISKLDSIKLILPAEENILKCKPLLALRNSTGSFDLLITETFIYDFFALFGPALKIPVILVHSCPPLPWISYRAALADNPSYMSFKTVAFPAEMSFLERLENTLQYLYALYFYKVNSENRYDKITPAFYGSAVPSIDDAVKNSSMLFLNSHHSTSGTRPMVPNVIEIGGITIQPSQSLPKVCLVLRYL